MKSTEYPAVLKCLIQARKRAGLTQQQLASRIAKPQSFVSKYENGHRRLEITELLHILFRIDADPHTVLDEIIEAAPGLKIRRRRPPRRN